MITKKTLVLRRLCSVVVTQIDNTSPKCFCIFLITTVFLSYHSWIPFVSQLNFFCFTAVI